jgi:outer membrane protein assembly factor BamB
MAAAIRTARAIVIVALVALSVVGLQVAPVLLLDSDGVASAGQGDKEWSYSTGNYVLSSPTVADGTIYVGSKDENLYAFDASTGSTEWSTSLGADVDSSPTVVNGTVYVGSDNNNVYALDASSGSKEWSYSTGNYVLSSPTVADGTVYVGTIGTSGCLEALNAQDGSKKWGYCTNDDIEGGPTVVDDTVYFTSEDDNLYALDTSDGSQRWSSSVASGNSKSSPTVVDGTVYVGSGGGNVYAFDTSDGSQEWTFSTGGEVESSPTVSDGTVYIGSDDTNVYALDASSGSKEWSYSTGGDVMSSPTVANGTVYVGSRDNNLYAFDTTDGSRQWYYSTNDGIRGSSPTVAKGTVYVGSTDSNVYALEASDAGADSEGSRNLHGTLGHNELFTPDGELNTPGEPLSGTVTDADGNAVENAGVEAVNSSTGSTGATTTTNATGGYEMRVDAGEYDVTASKSGYSPTTETGTVPEGGTTLNFTLTSDTSITDPDPPDGATVSEPPVELSVLANTTNQSVQSIDVEFYEQNDGSSDTRIGSTTVSPGERAAVTWDPPPNTYEWYAEGTADSGATDTGGPYTLAIGEAYIIDGTEQPPDGANVDPTADVDLAVDVHVDNDATVEFYDYQTGNPDNDPLIGSQTVSSGTSTASTRWYSNERDATEEWYVILKDSTGTRDTAGAFRFSAGGQVVARDADTGEIIDDRTVRFDATYPGGSQTFDRSPGVLNLSEVNADQGDRIRIDVQAQNYYERTVEVPNKQSDADIYLERGPNWSSNPSSDDPENTSSVEDDPDRYLSRFELEDRTGRYPPSNTTLAIKRDMDDDGQVDLIHRESFGAANRVGAHVKQDRQYQLIIENEDGDRRRLGAWTAIGESLVQLQVRAFDFNIPEQGAGWASHASVEETENDSEVFRWQFSDPSEATSRLEVGIYERDNRSNGLLNQTYSDLGNVSYTQELTGNQTGKAWVVELEGTRNGETFTSRELVGATDLAPGIPLDPFYQEMFAVLLLLVLAGVFGGIRAETGAITVPMTAAVLFWMGWLPGVVTASAIAAALFIAVLYRIRSTAQPGVR